MRTTRSWLLSCTALAVSSAMCGLGAPGDSAPAPAPTGLEWEQEQNLHLNKEAPTAFFASFSDLQSALKVLPENSKWRRSLNGQWKFHWAKDPQSRPVDFYKPDYDVKDWKEIKVPSSWQTQGYGTPIYSNQPYPFERSWPYVMKEPSNKNYTSYKERNPVGSYRRTFEVPADWDGREVYMQFDGVDSFFYLWINGQYVGFSKDSRNPARFDISPYLKGENGGRRGVPPFRRSISECRICSACPAFSAMLPSLRCRKFTSATFSQAIRWTRGIGFEY
ncbi:MAG: sugar-binding domain-containing protein [Akkermansia muciniphila]